MPLCLNTRNGHENPLILGYRLFGTIAETISRVSGSSIYCLLNPSNISIQMYTLEMYYASDITSQCNLLN